MAGRGRDEGTVEFETSKDVKVTTTFEGMGIKEDLLRGLFAYGWEKPSAIQQRAVAPIVSGRDTIAQAQSGTGKSSMIALVLCQLVETATREYVPKGPSRCAYDTRVCDIRYTRGIRDTRTIPRLTPLRHWRKRDR